MKVAPLQNVGRRFAIDKLLKFAEEAQAIDDEFRQGDHRAQRCAPEDVCKAPDFFTSETKHLRNHVGEVFAAEKLGS